MSQNPILIISGTNRPDAFAMKVAKALAGEYAAANVGAEVFSLADLPREIFDPSVYAAKPPGMVALQGRILAAPGLHVITPEYNGSFPGILKYFIDMLQFPESFEHKCVAFVGEAAGVWGGLRSVEQLVQIFGYRNAHIFPDRVFINTVNSRFADDGKLKDEGIQKRLKKQAAGFAEFVGRFKAR